MTQSKYSYSYAHFTELYFAGARAGALTSFKIDEMTTGELPSSEGDFGVHRLSRSSTEMVITITNKVLLYRLMPRSVISSAR